MTTNWIPLLAGPTLVGAGTNTDCAIPDYSNSRAVQLTAYYGGPSYNDFMIVNSTADGSVSASAQAAAICGVSSNVIFDGADLGRAARLGTDGKLYVTTTADLGGSNYKLSKITIGTLTESAALSPSAVNSINYNAVMVPFKIGATNYVALVQTRIGSAIEIINVDSMVSVTNSTYASGATTVGGVILGGSPDANSVQILILNQTSFFTCQVIGVTYSTISGLSVSTIGQYPPWMFDYSWDNIAPPQISEVAYDPADGGLLLNIFNSGASTGRKAYLCKISGTTTALEWIIAKPDAEFIENAAPVPSNVAGGHLFLPINDGTGTYEFIDPSTGDTTTATNLTHFQDTGGIPPTWDGPTNTLLYFDSGVNDSTPSFPSGFALFSTDWITPATAPPSLAGQSPASFDITKIYTSGSSITVSASPPFPNMTISTSTVHAIGGGQAGNVGALNTPGPGGNGGDYAQLSPTLTAGATHSIQIGSAGVANGGAGGDTWFKDGGGTIILRAKGGGSGSSSIGSLINTGGQSVPITHSEDGSYGNVALVGFGGRGGGGAAGPSNAGGDSGDTNSAVGQVAGSGGGAGNSPIAAPGQVYILAGHAGITGAGGDYTLYNAGSNTGHNSPFGWLDGLSAGRGGGGADGGWISGTNPANYAQGGSGATEILWTDSYTGTQVGPGAGGGGGGAGCDTDVPAAVLNCGAGGLGASYGGGGGGSGGWPSPGAVLGSGGHNFFKFTGTTANGGAGGQGLLVIVYSYVAGSPPVPPVPPPPVPPTPSSGTPTTPAYYIERMDNRIWQNIEDAWCLDSALSYPMPKPNATITASSATGDQNVGLYNIIAGGSGYTAPTGQIIDLAGTGTGATVSLSQTAGTITTAVWATLGSGYRHPQLTIFDPTGQGAIIQPIVTNYVTFSASANVFTTSDVGSILRMGGGRAEIVTLSSTSSVIANIISPITAVTPDDPTGRVLSATVGNWTLTAPTTSVHGLEHLEGMTVAALADGGVVGNLTVSGGAVTLPVSASQILVGLPFTAQLQTLYLEAPGAQTIQGRRKQITQVIVRVENSRAPQIGTNQPDQSTQPNQATVPWGVSPAPSLTQIKYRTPSMPAGQPAPLFSGDLDITNLFGGWDQRAQVAVQQSDPLPLTITAIIPQVTVGDTPDQ